MNPDEDCLACEGKNSVNWLLTRLYPPATIRVCNEDLAQAAVTLLAQELGVDADWLTGVVNDAIDEVMSVQVVAQSTTEDETAAEVHAESLEITGGGDEADEPVREG